MIKPGDLVRVRIWRKEPFSRNLGLVISIRSAYPSSGHSFEHKIMESSKTKWYRVWVAGYEDTYFEDEIQLVQELIL